MINLQPLEILLESAACQYYRVTPAFFTKKGKDGYTDKRRILFYLLYKDCEMTSRAIARRYNYAASSINLAIEIITFRQNISNAIAADIRNIRKLITEKNETLTLQDATILTRENLLNTLKKLQAQGLTQRQMAQHLSISLSNVNRTLKNS